MCSDTQIPFEHPKALEFAIYLKKWFRVPDENCYHVGDEVDQYWASRFFKDPNAAHTPLTEIKETIDKMHRWYDAFPKMKVAVSNHGLRWAMKASEHGIPEVMLRSYQSIIEAPRGWKWADQWTVKASKMPFRIIHGMGYSGAQGHRQAAIDGGISTAIGHLHSHAGVAVVRSGATRLWGMNTGCLIDENKYAFAYGKWNRFKPTLGMGVVIEGGTTPLWMPIDSY